MTDVHGSIWGGGTHVPQHMSHAHTGSLPVIALIPESGNPHTHLNCMGEIEEGWASQWLVCPGTSLHTH